MHLNLPGLSKLSLVLVCILCAACTDPDDDADPDALRVAISTFSDGTFLPWNGSSGRKPYLDAIYEYLVYLEPGGLEPTPGLAERWEAAPDGLSFTLWLRKGVMFDAGWGELTAEDVKYTFDRMMERQSIAGASSSLRYQIAEVEVSGRYEVIFRLKRPDIEFIPSYLSNGLVIPIASKKYLLEAGDEYANAHPVGTGPFRLASFREDTLIELEAVNGGRGNWRVRPEFTKIRFLSVPEEFTRAAMLKAGEVDIAPINYDSITTLEDAGFRVIYVAANWAPVVRLGGVVSSHPNPDVPWHDRRVRQAMNYAIDKEAIVQYVLHGQALITAGDFPAREWEDIEPYPYDPDKARSLLAEAGYADGFDLTLRTFTTSPGAELPIIAEVVSRYWRDVGIRATIVPTTWTSLRTAWVTGKLDDVVWTHRGLAFTNALQGLIASAQSQNLFASFADDHTDVEIEALGSEFDRARRAERIEALGRYLRDQASSVFIGFANEPFGVSSRVASWPTLSQQSTNLDLVRRAHP